MATSLAYYKNARSSRVITTPSIFNKGCYFTSQEVPEGYAKLLVNYEYTDDGQVLRPRMGITNDGIIKFGEQDAASDIDITLSSAHMSGLLYFTDMEGYESLAETILSFGALSTFSGSGTTLDGHDFNIPESTYYAPNIEDVDSERSIIGEAGWSILLDKRDADRFISNPYSIGHFNKDVTDVDSVGLIRGKSYNNINIYDTGLDTLSISKPIYTIHNGYAYVISTSFLKNNVAGVTCADPVFRLSQLKLKEESSDGALEFQPERKVIEIKQPVVAEATTVGYNMLSEEPYEFPNVQGSTNVHGIIPYEPDNSSTADDPFGKVLFSANNGETLRLNLVYSYLTGTSYEVKWEYKASGAESWSVLSDFTAVTVGIHNYIYYDITPNDMIFSVRATFREAGDATSELEIPLTNFELGLDDLKNIGNEIFDLTTCKGMFSYNSMLGLYGVEGAETTLFFSDIDNPGYFPFPHNMHTFDEQVLNVIRYLDSLIVITTNSMYVITGSGLPSSFIVKKLVTNINITPLDADLVKVIKDQVFFKADNTYFVLKPNSYSSDATDLRSYEVSKSINTFLQNFESNTLQLFNKLYPLRLTEPELQESNVTLNNYKYDAVTIIGYNQHVIDGRLNIVIRIELNCSSSPIIETDGRTFRNEVDLVLVYDTLIRQWYVHVYGLTDTGAIKHRRIDNQALLLFDSVLRGTSKYLLVAKFITDPVDAYSISDLGDGLAYAKEPKLPNWKLLSTGIVPLSNALYKRVRELQFTVDNKTQGKLHFFTDVYADGKDIISSKSYETEHITDITDPDYGHVFVNTYDESNLDILSTTHLGSWELDFSSFPDVSLIRAHLPLTGKGRFIETDIINRDSLKYEIASIHWVYRTMSAR